MPETVPGDDDVSRHLFAPSMSDDMVVLQWKNVFMFKSANDYRESLVWRKYAALISDVHALGCQKQTADRDRGKTSTYFGALTGNVGRIRNINGKDGARFQIVHAPDEDQGKHHIHISYVNGSNLDKNQKNELRKLLGDEFSERSDHTCAEE